MDNLAIIFGTMGVLMALGGVWVAIWATGAFEYMGGKKKPDKPSLGREKLLEQITGLNSPALPYQIKPSEKTDLEIIWKIADAEWLGIYAKEKIKRTYRAYMVLDEPRHTLRYWEAIDNVEWVAGAPKVHYQKEFFRGRIIYQKSSAVQYAFNEDKKFTKVYEYKFDIQAIRQPIKQKVEENGWEFVEVLKKKHAMSSSVAGTAYSSMGI